LLPGIRLGEFGMTMPAAATAAVLPARRSICAPIQDNRAAGALPAGTRALSRKAGRTMLSKIRGEQQG
jgi:hypothetical protein